MSTNKALLSEVLKRIEILEKKVEKLSTKEESSTKSKKDQVLEIERNLSLWSEKFPGINIRAELEKMLDWLKANNKRKKDYKAFFRNWLRKASSDLGVKAPQEEKI